MNFTLWWRRRKFENIDHGQEAETKLRAKCAALEQSLKISEARLSCITKVLGKQVSPAIYEIHTTDKGIPVVVCIANNGTEIYVYNLNNNPEGHSMLSLKATYHGNTCKILNLNGGIRLGHGTLAVERLKHHCKARGYAEVRVQFLAKEKEIALKLKSFFFKCGFETHNQTGASCEMSVKLWGVIEDSSQC